MNIASRFAALLVAAVSLTACTSVDSTEWIVQTRYGKIVNEHLDPGLAFTLLTAEESFPRRSSNTPAERANMPIGIIAVVLIAALVAGYLKEWAHRSLLQGKVKRLEFDKESLAQAIEKLTLDS